MTTPLCNSWVWNSLFCASCVEILEVCAVSILPRKKVGRYAPRPNAAPSQFDNFLADKVYNEEEMLAAEKYFDEQSRKAVPIDFRIY